MKEYLAKNLGEPWPTPETAAAVERDAFEAVPSSFARRIERERDEARAEVAGMEKKQARTAAMLRTAAVAHARAKAEVARLREELEDARNHEYAGELKAAHDEAARLRDAIRAVLAQEWLLDPQCAEDQALVDKLKEEAAE